ncbi:MAG: hypothetical protein H7067_08115, partial [Burkholderiales bacterium]|nr:hypothetical protein [Opitutaceae bacterium]
MSDTEAIQTPPPSLASYTAGQLDVIAELRRIQELEGLSDGKFAQKHLTIHASNWGRVKAGTYGADTASVMNKLETNLRQIRVQRAQASKLTGGGPFHDIVSQRAVLDAVTLAKLKPDDDCERLVVFLAETGGGKTRLGRELTIQHDGIFVEASEPWRKSYYAAVCDIARAAGVSEADLGTSEYKAQRALLARLRTNRRVLVIDEG